MDIFIRVKAAGKRKPMLELQSVAIPDDLDTAQKLITYLVLENVREYNTQKVDAPFFQYLTQQEYDDGAYTGRIGFGDRKNEKQQDEQQAVENALQSFDDGLYRILINKTEIQSSDNIKLKEGDILTFIKLTMLAVRRF